MMTLMMSLFDNWFPIIYRSLTTLNVGLKIDAMLYMSI